jgi:hypothetical protein
MRKIRLFLVLFVCCTLSLSAQIRVANTGVVYLGDITIFPNPFNENIFISADNEGYIDIMDITGKIIYKSKLSNGINEISTSHFLKGIYLVKIQNKDNSIRTFKIVKI